MKKHLISLILSSLLICSCSEVTTSPFDDSKDSSTELSSEITTPESSAESSKTKEDSISIDTSSVSSSSTEQAATWREESIDSMKKYLKGFDLIIDDIESHFHKVLVENMLSLYKDKSVNRHNATLIFTTHYCEILDLFNRQDNIWISKANGKVSLSNRYNAYDLRPELLKSKQFYNNAFQTSVNYEDLMRLKKELINNG